MTVEKEVQDTSYWGSGSAPQIGKSPKIWGASACIYTLEQLLIALPFAQSCNLRIASDFRNFIV
jgi:hypothetical protein